ncbi:hypothetical protein DPMN_114348 [Dreissena polymorpha]|uniref:Sushi domain-containing protein n=1 Tax=Dreissena polymorpha TaxID=45954 RepID=A0A9D4KJ55_DREPO|nr:hypothetical protein DPMN_114348 [Dreissena polymorpha]
MLTVYCVLIVTCPALTFTTGLQVTRVSEADRSVAHFSCKGGYSLLGAATLTCLTDRTWDAVQPTCGRMGMINIEFTLLIVFFIFIL